MHKLLVRVYREEISIACHENHSLTIEVQIRQLLRLLIIHLDIDLLLIVIELQTLNGHLQVLPKDVSLILGQSYFDFVPQQV